MLSPGRPAFRNPSGAGGCTARGKQSVQSRKQYPALALRACGPNSSRSSEAKARIRSEGAAARRSLDRPKAPYMAWHAVMSWRTKNLSVRHGWHHWRQKCRNPMHPCIMGGTIFRKRINALPCRRSLCANFRNARGSKTSATTVLNKNLATNQSGNSNEPITADRLQLPNIVVMTNCRSPSSELRRRPRGRPSPPKAPCNLCVDTYHRLSDKCPPDCSCRW